MTCPLYLWERAGVRALRLGLPALTADQAWGRLQVGVEIQVLR